MSLSSDIREYALELGYDRIGFTTAEKFTLYERELTRRRKVYEWAIESDRQLLKSADARNVLPGAKSIVVTVYDYFKTSCPQELTDNIGRTYLLYGGGPPHIMNQTRSRLLREFIAKQGVTVATGMVVPPARLAAARAGVATFGRNNFAYADGIGSFIYIDSIVIDAELEYNEPAFELKCPDKCTLCLDACPTGALYAPLKINPLRCIGYNTYATPGWGIGPGREVVPPDIRGHMNTRIYGCDACQQVCPRNQARLKAKLPPNPFLGQFVNDFRLDELFNMSDEHFRKVSRLLHYIKDKRYFQRNAAIALGNVGGEEALRTLASFNQIPDELVRGHAAWAVGHIAGKKAKKILDASLKAEPSSFVRKEIKAALDAS